MARPMPPERYEGLSAQAGCHTRCHGGPELPPGLIEHVRGEGQNRTADTAVFSRVLCQLSYLASRPAVPTGFEPATSTLTGWRARPDCSTGPSSVPPTGFEPVSPP
jgi:hypothetical protein